MSSAAQGLTDEQVRQADAAIGEHLGESAAYTNGPRDSSAEAIDSVAVPPEESQESESEEHGIVMDEDGFEADPDYSTGWSS